MLSRLLSIFLFLVTVTACSEQVPVFHGDTNPTRLSEWGLFTNANGVLTPVSGTMVFEPANQLFTDYASKLRTMWIPEGETIGLVDGEFDYPVGTVLTKTFYFGETDQITSRDDIPLDAYRVMETRLLVRRDSGWQAFPYVWNEEESEAFLRVAGASADVSLRREGGTTQFSYFVPKENQCAGCHVTEHPDGDLEPLGAIARQLHYKRFPQEQGPLTLQTQTLIDRGWLEDFPISLETISWEGDADLNSRAMAYLDIHCGHCHNPDGAADTSSLILDGSHRSLTQMGVCKTPIAAGGGAADMLYSIVPGAPERSILLFRMESNEPDEMMPELGRSLIHDEGVDLVREWISAMPGSCP